MCSDVTVYLASFFNIYINFLSPLLFVVMTFTCCFHMYRIFSINLLPGAEAVESQKAPLKTSSVEQTKNSSGPQSKFYSYGV